MSTGRVPGGPAGGALAGDYPDNVGIGAMLMAGPGFHDDFDLEAGVVTDRYGRQLWALSSGGTVLCGEMTPIVDHEVGVYRLLAYNTYGILHSGSWMYDQGPPPGTIFAAKLRAYSSSYYDSQIAWLGLSSSQTTAPLAGNGVDFVGVRNHSPNNGDPAQNWYGVVSDGTGETTVDLGVTYSSSPNYHVLGFMRLANGAYRFFTADLSDPAQFDVTWLGDEITTNHPTTNLRPTIGTQSLNSSGYAGFYLDFFSLGGRTKRSG